MTEQKAVAWPESAQVKEPYDFALVNDWCGGLENLRPDQTYNVTGIHLYQLLQSYKLLAAKAADTGWRELRDAALAALLQAKPGLYEHTIIPNRNIKAIADAVAALPPPPVNPNMGEG